ncbi:hypothetical protein EDC94DRAFT_581122 [Helicostylum pulchrum]|nr:hypothetical protein EDC94DRAFT_581122 [Helicostylum pulchrum]
MCQAIVKVLLLYLHLESEGSKERWGSRGRVSDGGLKAVYKEHEQQILHIEWGAKKSTMEGNENNIVHKENTQDNNNLNRLYCQYRYHKIHATRNTTGICVKCKKGKYDIFSERALKGSNFNKQQQIQYAKLSNSQSMKIEIFQQNTTDEVSTHCLLSNESVLYLSKNIS